MEFVGIGINGLEVGLGLELELEVGFGINYKWNLWV